MDQELKLLVVDDEEGMRMSIERALRNFTIKTNYMDQTIGYDIYTAASGEEALDLVASVRPDLMLLDHKLPNMSGLDVLAALEDDEQKPLTVMITAFASLGTAVTAIKTGAFDFVAKPFTPKELKASVEKATKHLMAVRQAEKLAGEQRKVRFQFMSVLAHELKAPLNAIENFLQVLSNPDYIKDKEQYDHVISRSISRVHGMRKMIMDLLDLTTIEAGTRERTFAPLNLESMTRTAMETVNQEAQERSISVSLSADEPLPFTGDATELEMIINNLITNAVKYNRDGGSVTVSLRATDSGVSLTVADTGIGMTEEETARLFNDFVRIKNEKTKYISGSGLGLSTVKKLAQLYNGDVKVKSEPDVGTTFTVTLESV